MNIQSNEVLKYLAPMNCSMGEEARKELVKREKEMSPLRFYIYGRMGEMKKFKPISGASFCTNLIYAEVFTIRNDEDAAKLKRELAFLNTQGEFELRSVS